MKHILTIFIIFCAAITAHAAEVGDTIFREAFTADAMPAGATVSNSEYVRVHDGSLEVTLPADGRERNACMTIPLPVEEYRGLRVRVKARVKAEDVAVPPNPWNGIKVMLVLDAPHGKQWLQKDGLHGTFDWQPIRFDAAIAPDAVSATLVLGLENTTGRVMIDDIQITVTGKRCVVPQQVPAHDRPVYRGHTQPRLRGAMISPGNFGPEDIQVLAGKWKANHVRWQLLWAGFPNGPADTATIAEYEAWIEAQCKLLDAMLPECKRYGVYVCLDLHTPPGGRLPGSEGNAMPLFQKKELQDTFVAVWKKLALRYKDAEMIWGYDLLNEPVEGDMPDDGTVLNWHALALKTAKEIRKIDTSHAIIVEPAPWGDPNGLDWFQPFDPAEVPNVVYSVHMYIPHKFTHQNVYDKITPIEYPGEIDGKHWDKDALRAALRAPREYVRDYHVPMYIGEFSAIRWAPGDSAYRYLRDCIEIFEEEGWDWAYHAFREWDGWSVEHGPDRNDKKRAAEPTDRELLLRKWFGE